MKDLNYWKNNAEEDYMNTPISVLRYITELEKLVPTEIVKFKVGDKIKITDCLYGHEFEDGEIVKIIEIWEDGSPLAVCKNGEKWHIGEEEGFIVD